MLVKKKATSPSFKQIYLSSEFIKSKSKNKTSKPEPKSESQQQPYWQGSEHLKKISIKTPLVILDRLPFLTSADTFKGHDCSRAICQHIKARWKERASKIVMTKQKSAKLKHDCINETIEQVIEQNLNYSFIPKVGDKVSFQIYKEATLHSPFSFDAREGQVLSIDSDLNLIELELPRSFTCKCQ